MILTNSKKDINQGPLKAGVQNKKAPGFETEKRKKLEGLIYNGTFITTVIAKLEKGTRIFETRFIDELKRAEVGLINRSRLVAQNYYYVAAADTPTKAPTIERF